jgi:hypothetical protein
MPVTHHGIHCKDSVYNVTVSTSLPDHMEKLIVTGLVSYTRRRSDAGDVTSHVNDVSDVPS